MKVEEGVRWVVRKTGNRRSSDFREGGKRFMVKLER